MSKSTWPKVFALWSEEKTKYASDEARLSVLRQNLSDGNDILAAERLTDLGALDTYLFRKIWFSEYYLGEFIKGNSEKQ